MPTNESGSNSAEVNSASHSAGDGGDAKAVENRAGGAIRRDPTASVRGVSAGGYLVVAVAGVAVWLMMWINQTPDGALVVYCAHDSIYADSVLDEFERQTGITVVRRFDTEATKSLGLVNLLLAEKQNPRCDVFWNNELLGTMKLKTEGVLQRYSRAAESRIPAAFRDPDGTWIGFSGRLRVWIINNESTSIAPNFDDARRLLDRGALDDVVMAKPLYGTTLTHYCGLADSWGLDELQRWHHEVRKRKLIEVNGNSIVKNLVAEGKAAFGWTDTDDYYQAVDAKKPVSFRPLRIDGKSICIPNTVAIIRGTKRTAQAERLVEFLTSLQNEIRLANSASRQIPLGAMSENDVRALPNEVVALRKVANESINVSRLAGVHTDCVNWLRSEYSQ